MMKLVFLRTHSGVLLFNLLLLFGLDSREIYLMGLLSIGQSMSIWASLVAQKIKNLPAVWETQVQSLGWEDPPGEGNGNPLQYSCLENLMDQGGWWATVHGVAKSQT